MQAWELDRDLGRALDKLKAIEEWLNTYPLSYNKRGTITNICFEDWRQIGKRILAGQGSGEKSQ